MRGSRWMMLPVILGAALWNCTDGPISQPEVLDPRAAPPQLSAAAVFHNPYAFIGNLHNNALQQVYVDVRHASVQQQRSGGLTKDQAYDIMTSSLDEFFSVRTVGRVRAEDVSAWRTRLAQHPQASARELMSTLDVGEEPGGRVLSEEAWEYIGQILTLADMSDDLSSFEFGIAGVGSRRAPRCLEPTWKQSMPLLRWRSALPSTGTRITITGPPSAGTIRPSAPALSWPRRPERAPPSCV